jgi:hypothetical protein
VRAERCAHLRFDLAGNEPLHLLLKVLLAPSEFIPHSEKLLHERDLELDDLRRIALEDRQKGRLRLVENGAYLVGARFGASIGKGRSRCGTTTSTRLRDGKTASLAARKVCTW